MLVLEEKTAVQAVVGSIVWAFRVLKKPRCREMSARGYALHSVCPQLSFFFPLIMTSRSLHVTSSSSLVANCASRLATWGPRYKCIRQILLSKSRTSVRSKIKKEEKHPVSTETSFRKHQQSALVRIAHTVNFG